ncbi:MAG: hypothetical protein LBK18_04730, partial [Prevotellaceae bacterium]|nr:hypothetical protein [Prevotellaceae bacterium]
RAKGLIKARAALQRENLTESERREYDYLQRIRSENRSTVASAIDVGKLEARNELLPIIAEKEQALAHERTEKERERTEKERALARMEAMAAELAALKSKKG